MGTDVAHEEGLGWIPPQGVPQSDEEETTDRTVRRVGLPPAGGCNGIGGLAGGGYLCFPPPKHSRKVYCNQANYGPVSSGKTEARAKGGKEVVGVGRFGFGGDADGGSGGGIDGGGEVDRWDGDGDTRLMKWEDTVANVTLGMDPNYRLAYAPVLEIHHPNMSTFGAHKYQLEIKRVLD